MIPAFDRDAYVEATLWASPWMAEPHLRSYRLTLAEIPDVPVAVYVAFDFDGRVRYVGSVARTRSGLVDRFRDHLAHRPQARLWTHVWVIELRAGTPVETVRWLEGVIGRSLDPLDNHRLPAAC